MTNTTSKGSASPVKKRGCACSARRAVNNKEATVIRHFREDERKVRPAGVSKDVELPVVGLVNEEQKEIVNLPKSTIHTRLTIRTRKQERATNNQALIKKAKRSPSTSSSQKPNKVVPPPFKTSNVPQKPKKTKPSSKAPSKSSGVPCCKKDSVSKINIENVDPEVSCYKSNSCYPAIEELYIARRQPSKYVQRLKEEIKTFSPGCHCNDLRQTAKRLKSEICNYKYSKDERSVKAVDLTITIGNDKQVSVNANSRYTTKLIAPTRSYYVKDESVLAITTIDEEAAPADATFVLDSAPESPKDDEDKSCCENYSMETIERAGIASETEKSATSSIFTLKVPPLFTRDQLGLNMLEEITAPSPPLSSDSTSEEIAAPSPQLSSDSTSEEIAAPSPQLSSDSTSEEITAPSPSLSPDSICEQIRPTISALIDEAERTVASITQKIMGFVGDVPSISSIPQTIFVDKCTSPVTVERDPPPSCANVSIQAEFDDKTKKTVIERGVLACPENVQCEDKQCDVDEDRDDSCDICSCDVEKERVEEMLSANICRLAEKLKNKLKPIEEIPPSQVSSTDTVNKLQVQALPSINIRGSLVLQSIPAVVIAPSESTPKGSLLKTNVGYEIARYSKYQEDVHGFVKKTVVLENPKKEVKKGSVKIPEFPVQSYVSRSDISESSSNTSYDYEHKKYFSVRKEDADDANYQDQKFYGSASGKSYVDSKASSARSYVKEATKNPDTEVIFKSFQLYEKKTFDSDESSLSDDQDLLSNMNDDVYKTFVNPEGLVNRRVSATSNCKSKNINVEGPSCTSKTSSLFELFESKLEDSDNSGRNVEIGESRPESSVRKEQKELQDLLQQVKKERNLLVSDTTYAGVADAVSESASKKDKSVASQSSMPEETGDDKHVEMTFFEEEKIKYIDGVKVIESDDDRNMEMQMAPDLLETMDLSREELLPQPISKLADKPSKAPVKTIVMKDPVVPQAVQERIQATVNQRRSSSSGRKSDLGSFSQQQQQPMITKLSRGVSQVTNVRNFLASRQSATIRTPDEDSSSSSSFSVTTEDIIMEIDTKNLNIDQKNNLSVVAQQKLDTEEGSSTADYIYVRNMQTQTSNAKISFTDQGVRRSSQSSGPTTTENLADTISQFIGILEKDGKIPVKPTDHVAVQAVPRDAERSSQTDKIVGNKVDVMHVQVDNRTSCFERGDAPETSTVTTSDSSSYSSSIYSSEAPSVGEIRTRCGASVGEVHVNCRRTHSPGYLKKNPQVLIDREYGARAELKVRRCRQYNSNWVRYYLGQDTVEEEDSESIGQLPS